MWEVGLVHTAMLDSMLSCVSVVWGHVEVSFVGYIFCAMSVVECIAAFLAES